MKRFTARFKTGICEEIFDALCFLETHEHALNLTHVPILHLDSRNDMLAIKDHIPNYRTATPAEGAHMVRNDCGGWWVTEFNGQRVAISVLDSRNQLRMRDTRSFGSFKEGLRLVRSVSELVVAVERFTPCWVYLGVNRSAVGIPVSASLVSRLLSDREKYGPRRAALRHFTDHAFRGDEDAEIWVRKHLKGRQLAEWSAFEVAISLPRRWINEDEYWREERARYAEMPPEAQAFRREEIRAIKKSGDAS